MKKRLIILGSTGSIGTKALEVAADFPERIEVVGLSAHGSIKLLSEQVARFKPQSICVSRTDAILAGANLAQTNGAAFFPGNAGLVQMIEQTEADIVLVATVGFVGLLPTLRAIDLGRTIALANKEVLVMAGNLVMAHARERGVDILPVDSEHNAVFQCLGGKHCSKEVRSLILTASGGPFRGLRQSQMDSITPAQALKHPTWNMGRKISIDSATLMNKGFEVIEAAHLFEVPVDMIRVVVHPQSAVHFMVEYIDGSVMAHLGITDMYLPIQNVLLHPVRLPNRFPSMNLADLATLTFEAPDHASFPCLDYAYESARRGGTYPAVLNAANEIAVERFLNGEISFLDIPRLIGAALENHSAGSANSLDEILEADRWAREYVSR